MKNDPERKAPTEDASDQSQASTPDEPMTEQEIALSETSSQVPETGEEPVPAGGDERTPEEKRIAQERELDEKLGTEDK